MSDMYSSPTERAKDEYWLNQDRIDMSWSERLQMHNADCMLALTEELKKFREIFENTENLKFMTDLYKIEE
jgi:hypothetical protein